MVMRVALVGILGIVWLGIGAGAESIPARMVSHSPRIFPAVDRDGFLRLDYRMSISAFSNPNSVNHELRLATAEHGFSHEGFFLLEDPILFETFPIAFVLDVPPYSDENLNGLEDFYDPAAAVENVRTSGLHRNASGGAEEFSATWNRAAGAADGTVVLELPFIGRRFTHAMSLLAYEGVFEFTREGTNLNGTMSLTNLAAGEDRITGDFSARIVSSNAMDYPEGAWNGPGEFVYRFVPWDRLDRVETNFVTFLSFEDGSPETFEPDYLDWVLILESGDANGNGILDLVEGATVPVERPRLAVEKAPDGIRITIFAAAGVTCALDSALEVAATNWTEEQSVTLTTGEATLNLPSEGVHRFFRARLE
jgi:hypothetical protein